MIGSYSVTLTAATTKLSQAQFQVPNKRPQGVSLKMDGKHRVFCHSIGIGVNPALQTARFYR